MEMSRFVCYAFTSKLIDRLSRIFVLILVCTENYFTFTRGFPRMYVGHRDKDNESKHLQIKH